MASTFRGRSRLVFLVNVVDVSPMPRPFGGRAGPGVWLRLGKATVACTASRGPGLGDLVQAVWVLESCVSESHPLSTRARETWLCIPGSEASTAQMARKGRRMNWEKRIVGFCMERLRVLFVSDGS